uniref:Zinc finger C2HC domain-containing protein 1A n=1 Tax=Cyclopterus lumpus TaxID=8103 RepID=A0A8C2XF32_CYCLU
SSFVLADSDAPPAGDLTQCNTCSRWFFPKVLVKHAKICQKSATKKRKVFDSSRQRAEGTDLPTLKPLKPKAEPPKKPSNWRKKHEDFIATIRAAKVVSQVMKDGGPLPPPPPPTYDPDYVQCPFCERRFNQGAADRHIKFCQEQAARMPTKGKLGDVKKPPGRTPCKPPASVKKANSPAVSSIPSTPSRLPQRSGLGQPTGMGTALSIVFTPLRFSPCCSVIFVDFRRNIVEDGVGNGGMRSTFCHACGTQYPVESAKFCCECGVKKMCL